jgi:hypothetical protein
VENQPEVVFWILSRFRKTTLHEIVMGVTELTAYDDKTGSGDLKKMCQRTEGQLLYRLLENSKKLKYTIPARTPWIGCRDSGSIGNCGNCFQLNRNPGLNNIGQF